MGFEQLSHTRREIQPGEPATLSNRGGYAVLVSASAAATQEDKRYNLGEVEQLLLDKTGTDRANTIRNFVGFALGVDLLTNTTNLARIGTALLQNLERNEELAWMATRRGRSGNKLFAREVLHLCAETNIVQQWAQTEPDSVQATIAKALGRDTVEQTIRRGADPRTESLCAAVKTLRPLTEEEQFGLIETNRESSHITVRNYLTYVDRHSGETGAREWLYHFGWVAKKSENTTLCTGMLMRHKDTIVDAFDTAVHSAETSYDGKVVAPCNITVLYPDSTEKFDAPLALMDKVTTRRWLWASQLWSHTNTVPSADGAVAALGAHPELLTLVLCGAADGSDDEQLVVAGSAAVERLNSAQVGGRTAGISTRQTDAEYRILHNTEVPNTALVGWLASGGYGEVGQDWLNNTLASNPPSVEAAGIVAQKMSVHTVRGLNFSTMEPDVAHAVAMNLAGLAGYISKLHHRPAACPPEVVETFMAAWEKMVGPDKWKALDAALEHDNNTHLRGTQLASIVNPRRIIRQNKRTRGHNAGWNVDGP